jgi:hypothetical protein
LQWFIYHPQRYAILFYSIVADNPRPLLRFSQMEYPLTIKESHRLLRVYR